MGLFHLLQIYFISARTDFDAVKDLHYADLRDEHQLHVQMSKFSGYFVLGILVLILQAFKQVYFLAQAEYIKFQ